MEQSIRRIAVNTGGLGAQYVVTNDPTTGKAKRTLTYDATGLNFGIRIDALHELLR